MRTRILTGVAGIATQIVTVQSRARIHDARSDYATGAFFRPEYERGVRVVSIPIDHDQWNRVWFAGSAVATWIARWPAPARPAWEGESAR
ncbi:MAG: hypothetical protein EXQ52_02260 [Bryobacterales bacterium]|nr:hypothetical protein [Bryobacterales bacterium]